MKTRSNENKKYLKDLNKIAKKVDKFLKAFLSSQKKNSYLMNPIRYGIFSGGKRFRAAIIFYTGKIFNINQKELIMISAAVECIHAYSLIHDDLPAMDNDELRRGKLTVHKKFNEFTAILAGNSLLTLAFEILSSKNLKLSNNIKVQLINLLSNCSGHSGIAGGQFSDLNFENKKKSFKKIIDMQNKKTGELFSFCCESPTIIKQKDKKTRNLFKKIGLDIGLLFQLADDLLDYKGNTKVLGKPTKSDKKKGKATLINLMGYSKTLNFANDLKKNIINRLKKYGIKSNHLVSSINFILNREF
ncbi:MAG: geranyl transferase [Candidatus Pelagibacter sp. TMED64]|nr:geranyl transferase [Candidatus Pelagibacter sp.]OUU65828.1 MAG: geranyl transferase [Candidatus Pelagibacter sp. TMED64]